MKYKLLVSLAFGLGAAVFTTAPLHAAAAAAPAKPAPQASAQSLAGGQAQSSGSAALMNQVVEKLMFVQKTLEDIGKMLPAAAPVARRRRSGRRSRHARHRR